jgi:hypothetical protein
MGCDCYRVSPAGPDALVEEQVREAAKILAISPLIESPKGLTAENWMGLARQVLDAALRYRPEADAAMAQQEKKDG